MGGIGAILGGAAYAALSGVSNVGRTQAVAKTENKPENKPLTTAEYNRRFDRVEISHAASSTAVSKGTGSASTAATAAKASAEKGSGFVPGMIEVRERAAGRGPNPFSDLPKVENPNETECQTCKERQYVDGSNDSGVSFQSPTSVEPGTEASAVRAHEQEHVTRNSAKAQREGMTARSSVQLHSAICPECGRVYISGGTTTTTYTRRADKDLAMKFAVGTENYGQGKKTQGFAA